MRRSSPRKSILKYSNTEGEKSNTGMSTKRISFEQSSQDSTRESKKEKLDHDSESLEKISIGPNLKITNFGLCYVPSKRKFALPRNADIAKQRISTEVRPDYHLILKKEFSSASVLIISEAILGDGLIAELEKNQKGFPPDLKLSYKCKPNPTYAEIAESDFFIFTIQLDKIYSVTETRSRMVSVRKHLKTMSSRCLVVGISSSVGPYADVLPPLSLHNLLVDFQIASVTFSFINRERKMAVLENIQSIICSSCKGNSVDPLLGWGFRCPTLTQAYM